MNRQQHTFARWHPEFAQALKRKGEIEREIARLDLFFEVYHELSTAPAAMYFGGYPE